MYLIISLGTSKEFEIYSNSFGWQALRSQIKSGNSRSCSRVGFESISNSSLRVLSEQALYQLITSMIFFVIIITLNSFLNFQFNQASMQESLYYEFEINIHRIYVDIGFPCNMQVKWKKGKNQSSGKFFKITDSIHFIDINDFIGIKVRCRIVDNKFLPQDTKVQVLLFPLQSNEIKVAGEIQKFDLTQMILFERRRENFQKKYELPLSKSTPNSRVIFTIYAKYLMDGQNQESLADVSFQAQSNPSFSQSTTDMTFRPPSDNRRNSRQKEQQEIRSPLMPPKSETRTENREEKTYNREKYENGRENRDQNRNENKRQSSRSEYRIEPKYQQRNEPRNDHPFSKVDMPLGFSFGPQVGTQDKEKQVKELLDNFNEVNRELTEKKKECQRLQVSLRDAQKERGGIDDKKLQLINQLNSAVTQVDILKKEKGEFSREIGRHKEQIRQLKVNLEIQRDENKDLICNFNRLRQETSQNNREQSEKLDRKQKEVQEIRPRLQKLIRQNDDLKNDLFRKQSELISRENQAQEMKTQYLNKSVPIIQQLKKVNQDLGRQRSQLQKALAETSNQLTKEKSLRQQYQKRARSAVQDFEKEKEKMKNLIMAFESKQKSNKQSLAAIQQEMKHFYMQKDEEIKQKDYQLQEMNRQLIEETKKREEQHRKREEQAKKNELINRDVEGNQNLISELKVKIKHLEEACQNLEKDLAEKEKEVQQKGQFIDKVREYVSKLEHENQQKNIAIKERDEFIAKAKQFITEREKELLAQIERLQRDSEGAGKEEIQKMSLQINRMKDQARKREAFVAELVQEGNSLQQKMEQTQNEKEEAYRRAGELEEYAEHMQERLQILQQQMEELVRKTRSQEETLSQLVKNKMQMEIQLNLCNFQLENLRRRV